MSSPQPKSPLSSPSSTPSSDTSKNSSNSSVQPALTQEPPAPKLPAAAPPKAASEAPSRSSGTLRLILWALVAALVLSGGLLLNEKQYSQALEGTVEGLNAELQVANTALLAHEARLEAIRGHVGHLSTSVGALQAIVGGSSATAVIEEEAASEDAAPVDGEVLAPSEAVTEPTGAASSGEEGAAAEPLEPETASAVGDVTHSWVVPGTPAELGGDVGFDVIDPLEPLAYPTY